MTTQTMQETPTLQEIYAALEKGLGHQWVHDDNVQALIQMAVERKNGVIEATLREWQAPCAP
ncbi:MAG: hypothetical protein ACM3VZ_02465 [Acidobacteriota bacterium]